MKAILRAILGVLVVITALPVGGHVSAQEAENTYTSVVTGSVVEWDPVDGAFIQPGYYDLLEEDGGTDEAISILTDNGRVVVNFTDTTDEGQEFSDSALKNAPSWYSDYIDILGSGSDEDMAWYLMKGTQRNNISNYSYSEAISWTVDGTTLAVYTYAVDPESTLELISWIQNHLTIDGKHVYTTTDVPAIEAMIDGTSGTEPERVYGFSSSIADWADDGLVSETQWISPIWGIDVEWNNDTLYFPTHRDDTIFADTDINADYLYLYGQDQDGMMSMAITEKLDRPADMTMQEFYEDRYTNEEWLSNQGMDFPSYAVVKSENAVSVIYSDTDSLGNEIIYIRTVWEPTEDVFIVFDVTNRPELVAETYLNVIDSVTFDGEHIEALWSHDELTALFPPSTEEAAESGDATHVHPESDGQLIWNPED